MTALPFVMAAPNGARLTKADHPAIPVTVEQTVADALACRAAGADGLHAHVRDPDGLHVLDAGLYRELIAEMATRAPGFYVQVTTEAVGRYTPAQQRALVDDLRPDAVSIAHREITATDPDDVTAAFFARCRDAGVGVQHILYDADDVDALARSLDRGVVVSEGRLMTLLVLGRYSAGQVSDPADLVPLVERMHTALGSVDWAVCAFGAAETDCLATAHGLGGKVRVGFENNRLNADGSIAANNAERVSRVIAALSGARGNR